MYNTDGGEWSAPAIHHLQSNCQTRNIAKTEHTFLELKHENYVERSLLFAPATIISSYLSFNTFSSQYQSRDSIHFRSKNINILQKASTSYQKDKINYSHW
jgi:hypothetical protein